VLNAATGAMDPVPRQEACPGTTNFNVGVSRR
jgi:hypothetical protein